MLFMLNNHSISENDKLALDQAARGGEGGGGRGAEMTKKGDTAKESAHGVDLVGWGGGKVCFWIHRGYQESSDYFEYPKNPIKPPKKILTKFSYPRKSWHQKILNPKNPLIIPVTWNSEYPPLRLTETRLIWTPCYYWECALIVCIHGVWLHIFLLVPMKVHS